MNMVKLSPYHEIFYNEWKLNPQRSDYNIVIDNEVQGVIDPTRLNQALKRFSHDYFLLHSRIIEKNNEHYWLATHPKTSLKLDYFATPLSNAELLAYVQAPFDLSAGPLLRAGLIRLTDHQYRIILVIHHVIMDGSKVSFIFNTLPRYYHEKTYRLALSNHAQSEQLALQSRQFEAWISATETSHLEFWQHQLTDLPGPDLRFLKTSPNTANPDAKKSDNHVGEYQFTLNSDVVHAIRQVTKKYAVTPYLLSQAIFAILLSRYTQQEKFGICLPVAIPEGMDFIFGVHVNPTIVPYHFKQQTSLGDVIHAIKNLFEAVKQHRHYHYPIQRLLSTSANKDTVEVCFTKSKLKNQRFGFINTSHEQINRGLNVELAGKLLFTQEIVDEVMHYRVAYKKQCIDAELLLDFIQTYQRVTSEIVADLMADKASTLINHYSLMTPGQQQLMAVNWNQSNYPYPQNQTLPQLLEEQVLKTPDAIAVEFELTSITYARLNEQANQLAHYLKSNHHIRPDELVVICIYPSHDTLIALWAVLKSGGAYVPIDPASSDEHIRYIVKDTKTKIIINDNAERFNYVFKKQTIKLITLGTHRLSTELAMQPKTNPVSISHSRHLAYVIYSSATSAHPKGTLIEHRSTVNYVHYLIRHHQLTQHSVGAKYASFSFDASVIEIYPLLLSGGKLCILKENDRSNCYNVNNFFNKHQVTYAFLPTAVAELFFELKNTSLKNLIVGNDKLKKYSDQHYRTITAFGFTETTVQSVSYSLLNNEENIPIGKPIDNVKCYVVDRHLNLMPIGTIGELLIGGAGLARGYHQLPELTAQQFIANPFQTQQEKTTQSNARVYKTGNLVRWLPDGNLEFIGRNETQVKIKGHRVELGEIETSLMRYPGIKQNAVIPTKRNSQSPETLAAYYVSDVPVEYQKLQDHLSKQLPEFMLPAVFMHVNKIPLNCNGKLDRNALPKPDWEINEIPTPPGNSFEARICVAYAQVLGLQIYEVSAHQDFFKMGGDSIAAIRLTHLLEPYFKITVADIFRLKTPANLVKGLALSEELFRKKIPSIKRMYQKKATYANKDLTKLTTNTELLTKYRLYLEEVNRIKLDTITRKQISHVLLTGSTGYLGCHILATLLADTQYRIYLPVRADSDQAAYLRVHQKMLLYFETDLDLHRYRIVVFAANLGKAHLGLEAKQYELLATEVDSIIHCASLVKPYGHDQEFYRANVLPTINLLEFTRLTHIKDFHYISSVSVLLDSHMENVECYLYTEDDALDKLTRGNHPYANSKYIAEELVCSYRNSGIKGNIYRVGNQAMNSKTYRIQENYEQSIFYAHLKSMLKFKIIPTELSTMEVSPVDCTATAIVKIFDKLHLSNQTHHVFNPHRCDLTKVLADAVDSKIWSTSFDTFIEKVYDNLDASNSNSKELDSFILYQHWLQEISGINSTCIRIAQEKTEAILAKLDFHWPVLTRPMFKQYILQSGAANFN